MTHTLDISMDHNVISTVITLTHTHSLFVYINYMNKMKSTKVQTLGGNIGTFGLETPLHAYVLGMPSIEPRSSTICIVLSMHVYM